jgi:hypothetical protein
VSAATHYLRSVIVWDGHEPSRDEILKVLTPRQRAALERLSGTAVEPKK